MALKDSASLNIMMKHLKSPSGTPSDLLSLTGEDSGRMSFSGFREFVQEIVESLRILNPSERSHDRLDGSQQRYTAVLCLAEGEHLRRALHLLKQSRAAKLPIIAGLWTLGAGEAGSTALVLEKDWCRTLLGASYAYRLPQYIHYSAMRNSLRFLNNDIDLRDEDITMLLRVLSSSSCEDRLAWWMDVRSCRRRRQVAS